MQKMVKGGFGISDLCKILSVSRNSYYWYLKTNMSKVKDDEVLKNQIDQIVLEFPRYGYRRITEELKNREFNINRKRTLRIMKENDLLCKVKRKFMITTDSNHNLPIFPNLIKGIKASKIDQIWVADITYIRLSSGRFVFLAIVLDLYSRKVVGWNLGENLSSNLATSALKMAIEARGPKPGLIHHSDRGIQYASWNYTDLLLTNHFQISMSRKGNPYDNAMAESFNKTLKWDEVYVNEYDTYDEARLRIANYIENIYNAKRLHSSLNYRSPEQFERMLINGNISVPI